MDEPRRIQLSRKQGFRLRDVSPNAVVVSRPTKWGNPWTVQGAIEHGYADDPAAARLVAVEEFRIWITWQDPGDNDVYRVGNHAYDRRWIRDHLRQLTGCDLACWCALPAPGEPDICHGAVLLDRANPGLAVGRVA